MEDRAEGLRACEAFGDFVTDVASLEIGENQHVGVALDRAVGILGRGDLGHERGVGLHFAVHDGVELDVGKTLFRQLGGDAHFIHEFVAGAALGGKTQEGELGLRVEQRAAGKRGGVGDVHELLGGRAGVDTAVGVEQRLVAGRRRRAQVHDKAGRAERDALGRADALERGAQHVRRGGEAACNEAVHHAEVEHHVAEEKSLGADGLGGVIRRHALALAALEKRLGEFGRNGGGGEVEAFDASGCERDACVLLGLGEFVGRGEHDGRGEAVAPGLDGGGDDAGIIALGQDDALVGGLDAGHEAIEKIHGFLQ